MFGKSAKKKPHSRIDTLIGAGTTIVGDLNFSGGLRIDGRVTGNVRGAGDAQTMLVISEHAHVVGEISVSHLVINGTVVGPVHASEFLELNHKARVQGDTHYGSIEIHLGAIVEGHLIHQDATAASPGLAPVASN
jgi:cytoskeletal protein CcmA (bactofilin family)